MRTVMFVCQGNICRSPLAEGIFNHLALQRDLQRRIRADSSGTIGYHQGELPDARMRSVAATHGVTLTHRAQQFNDSHFNCDLVLAMDSYNYRDILAIAKPDAVHRVQMFRLYDPRGGPHAEVPDPYYGGEKGFEEVYHMVMRTCNVLVQRFESGALFAPRS